jgi:hypothetical protein
VKPSSASRLIVTSSVRLQNLSSSSRVLQCRLVLNPGSGQALLGSTTYDAASSQAIVDPALTVGIDEPAGSYNFGVQCNTTTSNTGGRYLGGTITVMAAAVSP